MSNDALLSPDEPKASTDAPDNSSASKPKGVASILKKAPGGATLPLTTAQKKKELKQALSKMMMGYAKNFWRYDTDGSGEIDRAEFGASLLGLKLPHANDEEVVTRLFDEMDFDGSGEISQAEVIRYALLDVMGKSRDRIQNLCKLWDYDNSNTVNREEFGRILEALGLEVPVIAVDALFKDLDEDRTGELVYEEFTRKLRGSEGGAARSLSEPKPSKLQQLRRKTKEMMIAKTVAKVWPDFPPRIPPPEALPILTSSSQPPSDDEVSGDDEVTPRTLLVDGKELVQYLGSTRLQDAHAEYGNQREKVRMKAERRAARALRRQATWNHPVF